MAQSGSIDEDRIAAVLAGKSEATERNDEEKAIWIERFNDRMAQPGPEEENFFAIRRQLGLGVGLGDAGNLVRTKAEPKE